MGNFRFGGLVAVPAGRESFSVSLRKRRKREFPGKKGVPWQKKGFHFQIQMLLYAPGNGLPSIPDIARLDHEAQSCLWHSLRQAEKAANRRINRRHT